MAHPISKEKLAERCVRIVNGGKTLTENKVTIQDAMLAVAQARDQAVLEVISARKAVGEHDVPFDLLTEKTITAVPERGYHVAHLPTRGLSILSHNMGIFAVFPESDPSNEIFPVSNNHERLYSRQPALNMEGAMFYVPFQQRLRIYNFESSEECPIIVQYFQAGEDFTEDEFFCIAPEMQDSVVAKALQVLGYQQQAPQDFSTDSRAN